MYAFNNYSSNSCCPFPSTSSPTSLPLTPSRRNHNDECYSCGGQGHWAVECPNNAPKSSHASSPGSTTSASPSSPTVIDASFPVVRCACGKGLCVIKTSKTETNPGRKFYSCPGFGTPDGPCGFFKCCNQLAEQIAAPLCPCGAGRCSINKEISGPNQGAWYFACRLKKGQGACPFLQWADSNVSNIINPRKSVSVPCSVKHKSKKEDEGALTEFVSPPMECPKSTPNLPIMSFHDEVIKTDQFMREAGSCDPIMRKGMRLFNLISQSRIRCLQVEFCGQISIAGELWSKDGILGLAVRGWLGRLAFPPSQPLKEPSAVPFLCCTFPSFDPVIASEDVDGDGDMLDIEGLTLSQHSHQNAEIEISPRQDLQLSSDLHCEPSGALIKVHGNAESDLILKGFGEGLLNTLVSMNYLDHARMLEVAEAMLESLRRLSIDCKSFSQWVREYILSASRLAASECKDLSSQALTELCVSEAECYDCLSQLHTEAVNEYRASQSHLEALYEEDSRLKERLFQVKKELSDCEVKTFKYRIQVGEISGNMLESEKRLHALNKQKEDALELEEQQRHSILDAGKAALEGARLCLQRLC